jgi:hypothetical protein
MIAHEQLRRTTFLFPMAKVTTGNSRGIATAVLADFTSAPH